MDDRSAIAGNEASRLNEYVTEPDAAACEGCDETFALEDLNEFGNCEGCNERAYERSMSDYYGGGGPVSSQEHTQASWEERRELEGVRR